MPDRGATASGEPRLALLPREALDDAQRALFDAIVDGPRSEGGRLRPFLTYPDGGLVGPFNAWLRSPALGAALDRVGIAFRHEVSLPRRARELAILVSARRWRARFEWVAHAAYARREGVPEDAIEAIRRGQAPKLADPTDRVVHALATQLLERHALDDATYAEARERLGETALVELVSLLGFYQLVSMTLEAFRVPLPPGVPDPFADTEA